MPVDHVQGLDRAPNRYVTCYVASKLAHAQRLLDLRKAWPTIHFTARWPLVAVTASEYGAPAPIWIQNNVDDISRSETFLVDAEPADELKGAIWEAGVAWCLGKEIWLAGRNRSYSKWQHAPRIHANGSSLEDCLKEISRIGEYRESHADRLERRITDLSVVVDSVAKHVGAKS